MTTSIKNFIPVFNKVLSFYGIKNGKKSAQGSTYAIIFGRIWSYSQMKKKVCNASHSRIADDLYLSRVVVRKACAQMVEDGFLNAVDVGIGRPLEYTTNLDVLIEINLEVEDTCKQRIHPTTETEPVNVVYRGGKRCIQQPVNNVDTIIYSNIKEDIKEAPKTGAGAQPEILQPSEKKINPENEKPVQQKPKVQPALEGDPLFFLPATVRPLGDAFLEEAGASYTPIKADHNFWRKVLNEWAARHFSPELVKLAVREMRKSKLTIGGPQSITKVANSLKGNMAKEDLRIYKTGDPL